MEDLEKYLYSKWKININYLAKALNGLELCNRLNI